MRAEASQSPPRAKIAEIIGTVTHALSVRPWERLRLLDFTSAGEPKRST